MRGHDQIDETVLVDVAPNRVGPGFLGAAQEPDLNRDIFELLRAERQRTARGEEESERSAEEAPAPRALTGRSQSIRSLEGRLGDIHLEEPWTRAAPTQKDRNSAGHYRPEETQKFVEGKRASRGDCTGGVLEQPDRWNIGWDRVGSGYFRKYFI